MSERLRAISVPTVAPDVGGVGAARTQPVPGDWLDSLAVMTKLTAVEWRIVVLVMARGPISVFAVAKALRVNYTQAKRGVRGLARSNIVVRTAEGLVFQADSTRWKPRGEGGPIGCPRQTRGPSRLSAAQAGPPHGQAGAEVALIQPATTEDEFTLDAFGRMQPVLRS